jgi:peptidoglycan hydrolase-like protein with peptidoglycan-binding domain
MRSVPYTLMLGAACALMVTPAFAQKATSPSDTPSAATQSDTKRPRPSTDKGMNSATSGTTSESKPSVNTQPGTDTTRSSQLPSQLGNDHTMRSGRAQTGMSQNSDQVKQAQEALKAKGQDPGPVDGVMGPQTAKALRAYQKEEKISITGQLDQKTLDSLGVSGTSIQK